MYTLRSTTCCFLLLGLGRTTGACAPDRQLDSAAIYDRAKAASVEILVDGHLAGSGWFADGEGLVITTAHVLGGRKHQTEILSPVAGRLVAETVAVDRGHDLALLRVPAAGAAYPVLETARSMPAPGRDVYLFASPMYRHQVMVRGAVGRRSPTFEYLPDQGHYIEAYHLSAPSPKGTSGGCWLDAKGRVVGCQSGFVSEGGLGLGIALVTGPEAIRLLVRSRTSVTTPSVGTAFEELWSQPAGFIARFPEGTAGLVPVLPVKDGAAERAGLMGDLVITAVEGRPMQYRDELLRLIRARHPGDRVTFTVLPPDGAALREVEVTLAPL